MHNISWRIYEIPIETKKQNERPRRLEGTISGSKEWLEEIVAKGFLTEDEENFFNELENPVEIKEIAKKLFQNYVNVYVIEKIQVVNYLNRYVMILQGWGAECILDIQKLC